MTYQIIITEETAANIIIDNNTTNVSITTNDYPITIEYNAVIEQAGGNVTYGDSNVRTFLASGTNTGNIITTANVSGAFILGNGSQLTGLPATYGNANVAANLAAFGSNPISTTGNITAGYFVGNGSLLTNITGANVTGVVANATYALNANAATFATTAVQANVANVANSVAGANVSGTVANATYALNSNAATFATQATFAGTANAVAGANVSGTVANATYALNSNAATFAGTVTTAAQPNITSVGILTAINTSGNVSATGNVTGNYFIGNGSQLTGLPATYGNANVAANLAAFANNPISTSGNITAGYFVGNGSLLTGIASSTYGNANVANFLGNGFGSNTITTSGNITAGNINTTNYVAFGTAGAQTTAATGQMFWDTTEQTVSLGMNNGVTQQIGLEQYLLVKASSAITNGQAVMFTGANGDNVLAAPADTTSVGFRPEYIIGVATQNIANNAFGYITVTGLVHGLNTNAYNVGDILWVSNTTPGALTATRPSDPNFQIEIAAVTKKSGGDGHIQVRVTPFNNLDSLTDVTIITPATGQALVYSGNVWVNGTPQLANTANTVTDAAQANITSVGTLTSLSVSGNVDGGNLRTAGLISATGNITGGNVFVPINGRYYGDFTSGTASGRTAFQTTATGNSAATSLTAIPGVNHTVSNTAFSSQINLFANGADVGNSAFGRMQMFGNRLNFEATASGTGPIGNMRFAAGAAQIVLLNTGNCGIANANPNHAFSTNEAYFQGNISVTGNVIGSNVNTTGEVTATGNITGGNVATAGAVTATGNINGANLVASANLTSTQQTVIGTANVGTTGNIVVSGKNIATDMAWLPDGGDATTAPRGRIVVGTGWISNIANANATGNISHSAVQNRLLVQDTVVRANTTTNTQFFASDPIVSLTGNVTNNSFRVQGVGSRVRIGGGSAGNTISGAFGVGSVGTVAALQPNIDVGNISPYNLGNTTVSQATLNGGFILAATGSTVNNAYGMIPGLNAGGGNITNYIGFASQLNGMSSGSVTGNVYGVYHGSNATINTTGIGTNNIVRSAPGYYAFYNADTVAQIQLGSLRSYNEFQYSTATSGTVNIDKLNAQVQYITPTANVTIGDFQNFVSVANDGTNNDLQTDTVTLVIQQGATPYTVTMPTGNAAIKYAGGVSTIGVTANSVTMVSITAMKSLGNATGSTMYLASVSSEFS
jgi:hypothetical protein